MRPLDLHNPLDASLALLPELVLSGWALVVLLVVAWRHDDEGASRFAGLVSLVGVALAMAATAWLWASGTESAGVPHMIALDGFRLGGDLLILAMAFGTILLSLRFLGRQRLLAPEFHPLVLFATVGMMLLAGASDLLMAFLGLELMSIPLYVLAAYDRFRRSSAEAGVKYFLMGAFASGFLLYGIALIYGATGETNLVLIGARLAHGQMSTLATAGLCLLLVAFAFKVAAVPFNMWAPDVYDGAPTPVTGFMATGVKAATFLALARLLTQSFSTATDTWQPIIAGLAIATILVGNTVALAQRSLKRLLAYSSMSHAGYLLVAVWANSTLGSTAVLLYLVQYCVTTLAAFGVFVSIERVGSRTVLIDDLEGLFSVRPWAATSMAVLSLSLLGFPGTFGFIGKWYVISACLADGQVLLPIVVVLGSAISAGYYLPVIMEMTLKPTRSGEAHRQVAFSRSAKALVGAAVLVNLVFGLWPTKPIDAAAAGARSLLRAAVPMAQR